MPPSVSGRGSWKSETQRSRLGRGSREWAQAKLINIEMSLTTAWKLALRPKLFQVSPWQGHWFEMWGTSICNEVELKMNREQTNFTDWLYCWSTRKLQCQIFEANTDFSWLWRHPLWCLWCPNPNIQSMRNLSVTSDGTPTLTPSCCQDLVKHDWFETHLWSSCALTTIHNNLTPSENAQKSVSYSILTALIILTIIMTDCHGSCPRRGRLPPWLSKIIC